MKPIHLIVEKTALHPHTLFALRKYDHTGGYRDVAVSVPDDRAEELLGPFLKSIELKSLLDGLANPGKYPGIKFTFPAPKEK